MFILDYEPIMVNILLHIDEFGELVKLWEIKEFRNYLDNKHVLKLLSYNFGLSANYYVLDRISKNRQLIELIPDYEKFAEKCIFRDFLHFYESYKGPIRFNVGAIIFDSKDCSDSKNKNENEPPTFYDAESLGLFLTVTEGTKGYRGYKRYPKKVKLWDQNYINTWCEKLTFVEKFLSSDKNQLQNMIENKIDLTPLFEKVNKLIVHHDEIDNLGKYVVYETKDVIWTSNHYIYIKENLCIPTMKLYNTIIDIFNELWFDAILIYINSHNLHDKKSEFMEFSLDKILLY